MPGVQLIVIVVALVVGFWAIVMRPARTQQRRVEQLQSELEVGQEVVLSSGIFGIVHTLSEGRVELEVAPGTVITVARQVVVRRADQLEGLGATDPETDPGAGPRPPESSGESDPTKAED